MTATRTQPLVGFVELAAAIGCEPWDVGDLLEAGKISYTLAGNNKRLGIRLVTREAANRYLRSIGKRPLPKVEPE